MDEQNIRGGTRGQHHPWHQRHWQLFWQSLGTGMGWDPRDGIGSTSQLHDRLNRFSLPSTNTQLRMISATAERWEIFKMPKYIYNLEAGELKAGLKSLKHLKGSPRSLMREISEVPASILQLQPSQAWYRSEHFKAQQPQPSILQLCSLPRLNYPSHHWSGYRLINFILKRQIDPSVPWAALQGPLWVA